MITFRVVGVPATKGSSRGFVRGGRAIVVNDCKREKPWAALVQAVALDYAPLHPWAGPVRVELEFVLPRPGRLGKKRTGVPHDHRPDIDKMLRSAIDALTGVLWLDDSQIAQVSARKRYADPGEPASATFHVEPFTDWQAGEALGPPAARLAPVDTTTPAGAAA